MSVFYGPVQIPRRCFFCQMLIFSVEAVFTFYRLKPAGLLLCPERQSNQSALKSVVEVRSGGEFFRINCG